MVSTLHYFAILSMVSSLQPKDRSHCNRSYFTPYKSGDMERCQACAVSAFSYMACTISYHSAFKDNCNPNHSYDNMKHEISFMWRGWAHNKQASNILVHTVTT